MRALIFFLMSFTIEAKVIEIHYKLKSFKVDFNSDQAIYTASDVLLTLKKKPCNEHILKSFRIQMNKMLKGDFKNNKFVDSYSIKEAGITKYDSIVSDRGHFFSEFHGYFEKLKIEESFSCNKK